MATGTLGQSLTKMSVYTDDSPTNQNLLMPKLQYRFRVTFAGFGRSNNGVILTRQVIDVARPNVSFAEVPVHAYNSTIYLAGKHSWQALSLNVRDDALGSVTAVVGEQLQKQLDFAELASAASGQDYKFEMGIEMLDGGNGAQTPNILETWELYGCYLASVNYNTLNYATSEATSINMSIRFDNAVQVKDGAALGVGNSFTRTTQDLATALSSGQTT